MTETLDVKAIRLGLKLTQVQLAAELGVDQSTVSGWENGKNQPNGSARRLLVMLAAKPEEGRVAA